MAFETLDFASAEHIATVTLRRPEKLNALSGRLRDEIHEVCGIIRDDDDLRAAIFTGAGRGFCSGADLTPDGSQGEAGPPSQNQRLDDLGWVGRLATDIYRIGIPTIAAVNGVAAGAGMSLALGCDMRVGSELSRFKTVFAERALSPDSGMSYFLPRIIGYSRASDLIFTSRSVDAEEAYRLGLLDRLVASESLMDCAREVAAQMASLPPMAIRSGKRVLQLNQNIEFEHALRNEIFGLSFAGKSPNDQKESRASFLEKRKPNFTGT
jgi:2-(1,2-epoxy-1,2-dihydrophenyl)acetyl-CoA isomerase